MRHVATSCVCCPSQYSSEFGTGAPRHAGPWLPRRDAPRYSLHCHARSGRGAASPSERLRASAKATQKPPNPRMLTTTSRMRTMNALQSWVACHHAPLQLTDISAGTKRAYRGRRQMATTMRGLGCRRGTKCYANHPQGGSGCLSLNCTRRNNEIQKGQWESVLHQPWKLIINTCLSIVSPQYAPEFGAGALCHMPLPGFAAGMLKGPMQLLPRQQMAMHRIRSGALCHAAPWILRCDAQEANAPRALQHHLGTARA